MFCKKCSNLILPKDGVMKCSCGYVEKEGKLIDKKKKDVEIEIGNEEGSQRLPIIKAECSGCKNNEAYFWTKQTRSSDEPETRFFKCTKCKRVWREY